MNRAASRQKHASLFADHQPVTFQAVCFITHRLTRITYHIYSLLKILQGFPDQVFPDRYFPIRYFPIEGVIVPS